MCAKLGIRIIAASSPQAKGRVERVHGTHQDRLVKKLRLATVSNYDDANAYLQEHYIAQHNRHYARPAAAEADYHRQRPTARQLDDVFWLEEERRSEEHTSELQSQSNLVCRLLLEKKKQLLSVFFSRLLTWLSSERMIFAALLTRSS